MHAIPTLWRGVQFRSRLEARWAAFFTQLGWSWEYEPVDFNGYIPDFVLKFPNPTFVEVKPFFHHADPVIRQAIEKAAASGMKDGHFDQGTNIYHPGQELLVVGATLFDNWCQSGGESCIAVGLLGISDSGFAQVGVCCSCHRFSYYSEFGSFHCRVCGNHDGNPLSDGTPAPAIRARAEAAWLHAGNQVQWKPARR